MKLFCFECGKSVTNEIPDTVIFRGIAQCPECIDKHSPIPEPEQPLPLWGVMPTVELFDSYRYELKWSKSKTVEYYVFHGDNKQRLIEIWNSFVRKVEK